MKLTTYIFILITCILCSACSSKDSSTEGPSTPDASTLVASKIASSSAPSVSSSAVEAVWDNAQPLTITASPIGANFKGSNRTFPVTVKSVATDNDIYFLVQYDDQSEDYLRTPLAFLGGDPASGKNWKVIQSYDDGVSLLFEVAAGSTEGVKFKDKGCTMLCHTAKTGDYNPGMFSEDTTLGIYDIWYWHSGKSNADGYAEDKFSASNPVYAILFDELNQNNFKNNIAGDTASGYLPQSIAGNNNNGLDKRYFIDESNSVSFLSHSSTNPATGTAWSLGDRVPGFVVGTPASTRGNFDVQARGYYSGGKWTVKFKRSLATDDNYSDITLAHGREYLFSLAIHDATQPADHYGTADKAYKLSIK